LNTIRTEPNKLIKTFSNKDTLYTIPDVNIPHYWIRPQQILSTKEGSHRFMWDLHYQSLNVPPSYPISATYMNTALEATSPWVMPGMYIAKLTVDGKEYLQAFEVKMDPRVKTGTKDLQLQHDLSVMCYSNIKLCMKKLEDLHENKEVTKTLNDFMNKFSSIQNALQESDWAPTAQMVLSAKETAATFSNFFNRLK
jgi:hypothetical protein